MRFPNRQVSALKGGAPIRLAYCWSHARRRLREIYDSSGSEIAAKGLRRIAEFYAIEADIRGSPPERRLAERQARAAPLVEAFGEWLRQQRARVSPKSRLGEKLGYIARHWDGLRLFLANGRVEMDSNSVENLARPIALTRKNALEPPRLSRRPHLVRRGSCYGKTFDTLSGGGSGTGCSAGFRASGRAWLAMGGDVFDRGEVRLHDRDAAAVGPSG